MNALGINCAPQQSVKNLFGARTTTAHANMRHGASQSAVAKGEISELIQSKQVHIFVQETPIERIDQLECAAASFRPQ
jgi:hypothetical protein